MSDIQIGPSPGASQSEDVIPTPQRLAVITSLLRANSVGRLGLKCVRFTDYAAFEAFFGAIGPHSTCLNAIVLDQCRGGFEHIPDQTVTNVVCYGIARAPKLKSLAIHYSLGIGLPDILPALEILPPLRYLVLAGRHSLYGPLSTVTELIARGKFPERSHVMLPFCMGPEIAHALSNTLSTLWISCVNQLSGTGDGEDSAITAHQYGMSIPQLEALRQDWRVVGHLLDRNRGMRWKNVHAVVMRVALGLLPLRLTSWEVLNVIDWIGAARLRRGDGWDPHALRKLRLVENIVRSAHRHSAMRP